MKKTLLAALWVLAAAGAGAAHAACACRCVDGEVQALCGRPLELPPLCTPRVCALPPPSLAPIETPRLPPVGTTECQQVQVHNPDSGRYEWKTICR